ncbi:MAG: nickel-responsive transcriptional regulator NikR [Microbacteriaceae bacterium]|nr:nickel-responsive transcriptional regulator NikR [Burkholderiaceae bacterium]
MATSKPSTALVSRISVSLAPKLLDELDQMVVSRGFASRSHALSEMVSTGLAEHQRQLGEEVMVGNITLHYDRTVPGLQRQLADLQFHYIDEVISSLHVQLSHQQVMEVILVQGQAQRLQHIADEMATRRGVIVGRLQLLAAIMPPTQLPVAAEQAAPRRAPDRAAAPTQLASRPKR